MPYDMMTHPIDPTPTIVGEAAADMAAPALLAMKFDANGKLALPAAGDVCIGVVLATAGPVVADGRIDIQIKDIGYWLAGATVSKGALLMADATGKAVTASAGANAFAVALENGSAGLPVKVLICHTTLPEA